MAIRSWQLKAIVAGSAIMLAIVSVATDVPTTENTPYRDCPPVDARGWPQREFSFRELGSKAETERKIFEFARCFENISAVADWLTSNGFEGVREFENKYSEIRYHIAGSRSLDKGGAIYGGAISRLWQRLIVFKTSVAIYFDSEKRPISVSITSIIK